MRIFVLTFIAVAGIFSAAAQTTATTSTRSLAFPAFGLGATETAEVDLVNTAVASTAGTAASCTGTVTFVNATGATTAAASTFVLTSGQISSIRLPFSTSGGTATRTVISTGATHSLLTGSVETYTGRN